jgi:predicted DNA-binding antitoxin AbrB/MazE fold protein
MEKVIRARFLEGAFKPLERVELEEGKEVTVTIREVTNETRDAFEMAMGGWRGKIDCEIYKSRQLSTRRPAAEL